jgi:thiamine biosynthesis lipoprotein ApbE
MQFFSGAEILKKKGFRDYFVEIAGDIQVQGKMKSGKIGKWEFKILLIYG